MPKKKTCKLDELKDEYKNVGEFMEAIPDQLMVFKKDVVINDTKTKTLNDRLYLVYEIAEERNSHFGERTAAYMRDKETKKIHKIDQERLRKELGEILMQKFDTKKFFEDFVITLSPMELMEAYDRAVIKKGKVKHVEGCSKFLIHGQRGPPMELMLRN